MEPMDYAAALRELLAPLGIYDVERGLGAAELESVGAALNGVYAALTAAETEASPLTAGEPGLAAWESLLPFVPAYRTQDDRRRAVSALLRVDGMSFTPAAVNDTIAGCGIRAVVAESETPQTVCVSFPWNRGEPDNFEALRARIEQILPCHLAVEYVFVYVLWARLEEMLGVWSGGETYRWREAEALE